RRDLEMSKAGLLPENGEEKRNRYRLRINGTQRLARALVVSLWIVGSRQFRDANIVDEVLQALSHPFVDDAIDLTDPSSIERYQGNRRGPVGALSLVRQ